MAIDRPCGALAAYVAGSRRPRLSPEEEEELLRRGDEESLHRVVESNLALVVSIATSMGAKSLGENGLMDVIQAGNEELVKAARMYRPDEGVRFGTYATYWVRSGVSREMAAQHCGLMQRPSSAYSLIGMISFLRDELAQMLGRFPTTDDIEAALVGVAGEDELDDALRAECGVLSLDAESEDDEGNAFGSMSARGIRSQSEMDVVDGSAANSEAVSAIVAERIVALDPKQRLIIEARFGLGEYEGNPLTLTQTADAMVEKGLSDRPLTKERVRQLEAKALAALSGDRSLRDLWEGGI